MSADNVGIICLFCGFAWGLWFGYYHDGLCSRLVFVWGLERYKWILIQAISKEFGSAVLVITTEKEWLYDRHEKFIMRVSVSDKMTVEKSIEKQDRVDHKTYLNFPSRIRSRLMRVIEYQEEKS